MTKAAALKKRLLLFVFIMVLFSAFSWYKVHSFSDWVMEVGARGDDVYELQGRLSFLGYYHGDIDGIFGWQTYWSVRNFQYQFGMKVDGVVGQETKRMLVRATRNWTPKGGGGTSNTVTTVRQYNENDVLLMARAVHGEARGEPYEGKVAVAAVILNRVQDPKFPDTVSGVIFQPRAFTAVDDGQIWLEPDQNAFQAVRDAINGWDPSNGALYYFNPATATSAWIWSRPQIKQIGKHIFCM